MPQDDDNIARRLSKKLVRSAYLVCLLSLAACNDALAPSDEAIATFRLTTDAKIGTYAVVPDQLKLAAARIFRDLAIRAPTASPAHLHQLSLDTLYSEKGVHRSLAPEIRRDILPHLATIRMASTHGDRAAVSASALEASRLLCQDLSSAAGKQGAFALLDYALLAVRDSLDAVKPDWRRIDAAMAMAADQRQVLADRADAGVDIRFDTASSLLVKAVSGRDAALAAKRLVDTRRAFDEFRRGYDGALPDQALASARKIG